jgi:hypothetical protein
VGRIAPPRGKEAWRRTRVAYALACAALGLLGFARPALGHSEGPSFKDRVIQTSAKAPARTDASAPEYAVPGGGSVNVQVDPAYAGTGALERVLDALGRTVHGPEMNSLSVHIADQANLNRLCGQGGTACYYASSQTMVVSGSPINTNNQMPQDMVITHEYGHHIEANRTYPGWSASDLGGRHWATYERVCEGVGTGRLFPGDQGAHYWENPGEAFAQAYAEMHYPHLVPWWWSFAEPDRGAFAAIRADVADTSPGRTVMWTRTLAPGSPRARTTLNTSLDGPIAVKLRHPRRARFDLELRSADGKLLSRGRTARAAKGGSKGTVSQLRYSSCGSRSFTLEVRRRAGTGKFKAKILRP